MLTKKRILVIDDDESICNFLTLALKGEGYEVEVANNGMEALKLIHQNRLYPYNLILLDMQMPVMDGWKFLPSYHEECDKTCRAPIIVMTAPMTILRYASHINADGYLPKPFNLEQLLTLIQKYLTGETKYLPTISDPKVFPNQKSNFRG